MSSFDLGDVDHFTAGAVGEPGARTFLLQAATGGRLVTVKCEKQQVAALTEYLQGVLADLPVPDDDPPASLDLRPPLEPEWSVGSLSVAYDDAADRVVLLIEEAGVDDPDDVEVIVEERGSLRARLRRGQVKALVEHNSGLVQAGRPDCPICGHPRGPDHACPRTNGHGPPS